MVSAALQHQPKRQVAHDGPFRQSCSATFPRLIACAALAAGAHPLQAATAPAAPPAPLAYETSAYELAPELQPGLVPWRAGDLKRAILERLAREKQRREMDVYYYRIGYTMSYPLPLDQRPTLNELPAPLPGRSYPWLIWLTWDLEDRWRLFHRCLAAIRRP